MLEFIYLFTWSLGSAIQQSSKSEDDGSLVLLHHLTSRGKLYYEFDGSQVSSSSQHSDLCTRCISWNLAKIDGLRAEFPKQNMLLIFIKYLRRIKCKTTVEINYRGSFHLYSWWWLHSTNNFSIKFCVCKGAGTNKVFMQNTSSRARITWSIVLHIIGGQAEMLFEILISCSFLLYSSEIKISQKKIRHKYRP